MMQTRWTAKNVNLELLTNYLCDFLQQKDFEIVKGKISGGYQIFASCSPRFKLDGYISISVKGKPDDFVVSVELCKDGKTNILTDYLASRFIGGYFFLQKLKLDENWAKLEKELTLHIKKTVLHLTNSS